MSAARARRALRLPPHVVARRLLEEATREGRRLSMQRARNGRGPLALAHIVPGGVSAALGATRHATAGLGAWDAAIAHARSDPRHGDLVAARAARARRRELELFGDGPVTLEPPLPWHADVRSGLTWPPAFHRRLDVPDRGRPSDVKVPWELSRLRHLVALAQGAAVQGDAAALAAFEDDLADWVRANPLGCSVNWAVAMEVALRAVNLICADAILTAGRVPYASRPVLVASLYAHGWFLARHLEVAAVNGNHFLADAVGLVWLGRYFGGVGEGDAWLARGIAMTEEALERHVLPDGLDQEGSLRYHALVLELLLLATTAAGPLLPAPEVTLRRMLAALSIVAAPDGTVPALGDDDGGRALALSDAPSHDARRVLALGGSLLGEGDAQPVAEAWALDAAWLAGPDRVRLPAAPDRTRPRQLEASGVVVLGNGRDHVVVDVGPIGFRGLGGHGHVDALSLEARLAGHLAVPDSGTGTYTRDPSLRNRLRDAAAHTLVVVDDRPYARIGDATRLWAVDGDSPPRVLEVAGAADHQWVVAEQDLPARGGAARVRRRVGWSPGTVAWRDTVEAPPASVIRSYVQLPAGARQTGPDSVEAGACTFAWELPPHATLRLEDWRRSSRYDSTEPGCRAVVEAVAGATATVIGCTVRCSG